MILIRTIIYFGAIIHLNVAALFGPQPANPALCAGRAESCLPFAFALRLPFRLSEPGGPKPLPRLRPASCDASLRRLRPEKRPTVANKMVTARARRPKPLPFESPQACSAGCAPILPPRADNLPTAANPGHSRPVHLCNCLDAPGAGSPGGRNPPAVRRTDIQ